MLKKPSRLLLHQLSNHVAKYGTDRIEPFVGSTYIVQPGVVEQNLLHDEDGNGFRQLGACLHDPKAERNDLGRQEEVDNLGRVVLDQGADDSEAGEAKIFEGARLGGGVEEGIEVQRDVGWATLAEAP